MNRPTFKNSRRGAALLIVLFIVMAITLFSMAFIARSDVELACGKNMPLRMQMDYTAQSALTHAKALIVSPTNSEPLGYWQDTGLQVQSGDDYYDLTILAPVVDAGSDPNLEPTYIYDIQCCAYRKPGTERIAQSALNARLRFDPSAGDALFESVKRD